MTPWRTCSSYRAKTNSSERIGCGDMLLKFWMPNRYGQRSLMLQVAWPISTHTRKRICFECCNKNRCLTELLAFTHTERLTLSWFLMQNQCIHILVSSSMCALTNLQMWTWLSCWPRGSDFYKNVNMFHPLSSSLKRMVMYTILVIYASWIKIWIGDNILNQSYWIFYVHIQGISF